MKSSEIAKLAGVSRSTVSRVINNYSNVPEKTRKKVMDIVEKYNYSPNISAQNLAGKKNKIIGVFVYDIPDNQKKDHALGIDSLYFKEFVTKVMIANNMAGYMSLIEMFTEERNFSKIEVLFENNIISGGIFIGFPKDDKWLTEFSKKDYQIVCVDIFSDRSKVGEKTHLINTKNYEAAYAIVADMIDNGYKKIAYIGGDEKRISMYDRRMGYLDALADKGIELDDIYSIMTFDSNEKGYEKTKKLLRARKVDAIFAANDSLGVSSMEAVKEMEQTEIFIHGFDNFEAKFYNFSSAEIDHLLVGKKAVELIDGEVSEGQEIKIEVDLIKR